MFRYWFTYDFNYFLIQESHVWRHVSKVVGSDRVECLKCPTTFTMNTNTISRHLDCRHNIGKSNTVTDEAAAKQPKIESFSQPVIIKLGEKTQNKITELLSVAIGSSPVAFRFIENKYFRDALKELNPGYTAISRKQLSDNVTRIHSECKDILVKKIDGLFSFSITVDFWSKNGLGYLGVTLNFADHNCQLKSYLLELCNTPFPHTADVVLRETDYLLRKYGINGVDDPRLSFIITDNGSNMVKAYKDIKRNSNEFFEDLANDEISEDELLSDSDTEDFKVLNDAFIHHTKRLGCCAHAANNVIKTSMKGSIRKQIEPEDTVSNVLGKLVSILKQIKRNGQCCNYLKSQNAYITLAPDTRWIYQYMVIDLFFKFDKVYKHCAEEILKINFLLTTEVQLLKNMQTVFDLFSKFVKKVEGQQKVTVSHVLPKLIKIKKKLDELKSNALIKNWVKNIEKDLDSRFEHILKINSPNFDVIYSLAFFMDPNNFHLTKKKKLKPYVKEAIRYINLKFKSNEPVEISVEDRKGDSGSDYSDFSSDDQSNDAVIETMNFKEVDT